MQHYQAWACDWLQLSLITIAHAQWFVPATFCMIDCIQQVKLFNQLMRQG